MPWRRKKKIESVKKLDAKEKSPLLPPQAPNIYGMPTTSQVLYSTCINPLILILILRLATIITLNFYMRILEKCGARILTEQVFSLWINRGFSIHCFMPKMAITGGAGPGRSQGHLLVLLCGFRGPFIWAIFCCLPQCIVRELDWKWGSPGPKLAP